MHELLQFYANALGTIVKLTHTNRAASDAVIGVLRLLIWLLFAIATISLLKQ